MADEVLLKEPLTDQMIREGEALTRQLDDMGVPLTASFWLYASERNDWRLTFASPLVASEGQLAFYDTLIKAMHALNQPIIDLLHISVFYPNAPVVQALSTLTPDGVLVQSKRFNGALDRYYIDDAYLYRIAPTAA
jgi:hypothetical protein